MKLTRFGAWKPELNATAGVVRPKKPPLSIADLPELQFSKSVLVIKAENEHQAAETALQEFRAKNDTKIEEVRVVWFEPESVSFLVGKNSQLRLLR